MSPWFYIIAFIIIALQLILIIGSAKMRHWEKEQMQRACGTLFVTEGEYGHPDLYLEVDDFENLTINNVVTIRVVRNRPQI